MYIWEDAYSICEDEFFPEADESVATLRREDELQHSEPMCVQIDTPALIHPTRAATPTGRRPAA